MKKRFLQRVATLLLAMTALCATTAYASFFSIIKNYFSAGATLAAAPALTISVTALSNRVFSGKNFVIPVKIVSSGGPLSSNDLQINVVYQLFDASGNPLNGSAPTLVDVEDLQVDPSNPYVMNGVAFIKRSELAPAAFGGQLKYFFQVRQGAAGVYLGGGTAGTVALPTSASLSALIVNGYVSDFAVSFDTGVKAAGGGAYVPSTFLYDGATGLRLTPGALTNDGTLHMENLDVSRLPQGPGGSRPIVAYNFSLIGTTLQKEAQLVLSYPADLDGNITDHGGSNPLNLVPYWWDGVNWRVLARPQIDTTLHTVTASLPPPTSGSIGTPVVPLSQGSSSALGSQFTGSFALFIAGAPATAADLRPMERIITPNGDGINDVATFSGLVDGETVHIFDVRGRRVRTIHASNATATQWDGRDDSGSIVDSGVYIYQYESQGSRVSGVIVVAK